MFNKKFSKFLIFALSIPFHSAFAGEKGGLALTTPVKIDQDAATELSKLVGGKIKDKINRCLGKDAGQNIKVIPVKNHHMTHLMIGKATSDQEKCVNKEILNLLNSDLKNDFRDNINININVTGAKDGQLILFKGSKYIALTLPTNPIWMFLTDNLDQLLKKNCKLDVSHYKTYQKGDWIPHLSVFRIEPLDALDQICKDGSTLRQSIENVITEINKSFAAKNMNLGKFKIDNMLFTKSELKGSKVEFTDVAKFEYNAAKNNWTSSFEEERKTHHEEPVGDVDPELIAAIEASRISSKEEEKRRSEEKESKEITILDLENTNYYSFDNKYEGSPAQDSKILNGIQNYNPAKGLNLKINDPELGGVGYWKSIDEYYQTKKAIDEQNNLNKSSNKPGYLNKDLVIKDALMQKFNQIQELKQLLLSTGTKAIIYDSDDSYWGAAKDKKGKNKLGKLLEEVRKEIR